MNKLLPCPFCGGEALTDCGNNMWSVGCKICHARTWFFEFTTEGRNRAIKAWNTRTEPKEVEDLIERFEKKYQFRGFTDENFNSFKPGTSFKGVVKWLRTNLKPLKEVK